MITASVCALSRPLQLLAGLCLTLAAAGGAFALDIDVKVKLPYHLAYKLKPIDIEFTVNGAEAKAKAVWRIYDFYKNDAMHGDFPAGDGKKSVAFTPKKFGWYLVTCDVEQDGNSLANGSKFIGITPEFPNVYTAKEGDFTSGWNDEALQAFSGLMLDRTNTRMGLDHDLKVQENADKYGVTLLMQFEGAPTPDEARAAVTKLKGKVKYWEIVNEPNFSHNPQSYAELCKTIAPIIHEVDPKAIVMGCDTCGIDLGWYDAFYKAGGGAVLDVISTHTYEGDGNIDPFHWFWKFGELRKIMANYGDQKKPIWQTERATGGRIGKVLTCQTQAIRITLERDILEALGIPNNHNNHYYAAVTGYEDVATYVFTPSGPYPAALACRTRQGMIVGKKFSKRLEFGVTGDKLFLGLLYDGADGSTVTLRNYGTLDYSMPLSVSGGDKLEVVDSFGNVDKLPVTGGKATVVVTQLPVYLRLAKGQQVTPPKLDLGKNIAAEATFTYSEKSSGDAKALTDGLFQLWHNQNPWGGSWTAAYAGTVFDESPQNLEMAFTGARSIAGLAIWGEHADNPHSALLDYDLQYHDGKGWVTIEEVRVPCPPSMPARTHMTEVASWYLDNNCFIHQFKKPITTDRLRIVVRRISRGCFIDMIAERIEGRTASGSFFALREIEIYKAK